MEHWCSAREPKDGRAVLTSLQSGITVAVAKIRNIGLGGMYVATDPLSFPINSAVLVGFALINSADVEQAFRLQAMVVRVAANGIGLMFFETAAFTNYLVRQVLYAESARRVVAAASDDGLERVSRTISTGE